LIKNVYCFYSYDMSENINDAWFPLNWGSGCPAAAPRALLSLAALGDMLVKPEPPERVRAEIAKVFPQKRFVWLTQEHTRIVLPAGDASGRSGDGLVTSDPEILLGVTVADCLPVFLWDTATGARSLCHSGWKGTGIVREALSLMKARYGAATETIRAILGPCIHSCCYAVPSERAETFAAEFGSDAAFQRDGDWYIDLVAANKSILLDEGIGAIQIYDECTCCDTRFSSYRRQGKDFTHMLALCGVYAPGSAMYDTSGI
jgi:hypothetical protein